MSSLGLSAWLQGLIAAALRPIIVEEIRNLKLFMISQWERKEAFEKYDQEAMELISAAEKATTTEEVKAHLRKLRSVRARLNL